jgi:metal-responsive CopG/Arc/MetJ family transcriptional regulator
MSRRRSVNPTKAISITLPNSLLDKLDDKLSYTESRSAWISGAIRMRLDDSSSLGEVNDLRLKVMLHSRVCGCHKTASCPTMVMLRRLTSSNPSEEV